VSTKKTIILGVTGGIAAFKACEIVSRLKKLGYAVRVVMTKNATEFVAPLTFETLSGAPVSVGVFDKGREFDMEHISYSKLASAYVIAPCTANVIGKLAAGIADDLLTTTVMAAVSPVVICPAMNTNMYLSAANQENIKKLKERGFLFVDPAEGLLACGDVGVGRLAEPSEIVAFVDKILNPARDLDGKTVLVTAGGTEEPVDPVRFIGNRSSGRMGAALAEAAIDRGARVVLIAGRVSVELPEAAEIIRVKTTAEMFDAVIENVPRSDMIVKAAAPADYKVKNYSKEKIKAGNMTLELVKNPDIAKEVGRIKGNRTLVIFAAESGDLIKNAAEKLAEKNADMIVANDVTAEGAGFETDTNIATIIKKGGEPINLPKMSKRELADKILDAALGK
jgi:phosphopantothenoylcysteine decarboxylase/phosphopantothenate--cysteine ligase, prokaryotic